MAKIIKNETELAQEVSGIQTADVELDCAVLRRLLDDGIARKRLGQTAQTKRANAKMAQATQALRELGIPIKMEAELHKLLYAMILKMEITPNSGF